MNKFGAHKVYIDGHRFDSYAEYEQWLVLKDRELCGEIRGLERQLKIPLMIGGRAIKIRSDGYPNGRKCSWTVDFAYFEGEKRVFHEKKGNKSNHRKGQRRKFGTDTTASRLRRAIVEAMYPDVEVRVT